MFSNIRKNFEEIYVFLYRIRIGIHKNTVCCQNFERAFGLLGLSIYANQNINLATLVLSNIRVNGAGLENLVDIRTTVSKAETVAAYSGGAEDI